MIALSSRHILSPGIVAVAAVVVAALRLLGFEVTATGSILLLFLLAAALFALARGAQRAELRLTAQGSEPSREHRLCKLAAELPGCASPAQTHELLVRRTEEIFGARPVTLLLSDTLTGRLEVAATTSAAPTPALEGEALFPPEEPWIQTLQRIGRPIPLAQLSREAPTISASLRAKRVAVTVPLILRQRLLGVLLLGDDGREPASPSPELPSPELTSRDLDLLELLGRQAAGALESDRLAQATTHESLTGLLRRGTILTQLDHELERALRFDRPLTIGMADLDHFKTVNDRFGHLTGDRMLREVARILSESLRQTDIVGRYGGEEFLLLLPETDLAGASTVAEKLRVGIQAFELPLEGGEAARITLSIGLAGVGWSGLPNKPTSQELLAAADRSLYLAKRTGRNRIASEVPSAVTVV